jgi:flagellar hook protein FlgE
MVPVGGTTQIALSALPTSSDPAFTDLNIYRNRAEDGTDYELVATIAEGTLTHNDMSTAPGATLDVSNELSSNTYSYYITFYDSSSGNESRPSAQFGPITTDAGNSPNVRLDGFPTPVLGEYDQVRIYRNVTTDPGSFYLLDTIDPALSYIDDTPDAAIVNPANLIDLEGPPISPGTLLTQVVSRDEASYNNLFQVGTLSFTGSKNGRELAEREFQITATSTVQDLISFMSQSLGIVTSAPEDTFPPSTPPSTFAYGGAVTGDGRLQFTSNMGEENAIEIDLSAFRLTPAASTTETTVPVEFSSTQTANGGGSTAEVVAYDSLGTQVRVSITTVLEQVDSTGARFRWIATSPDHNPDIGFSTVVGTGVITTDGNGKFVSTTENRVAIDRGQSPAISPLEFELDFAQVTGLDDNTEWAAGVQDGLAAGTLTSFIISESGRIQGVFSNGSSRDLGQIRMARFANNGGLEQLGDNLFAAGVNSGLPIQGDPGSQGIGNITAGAVELSNTDIGQNLIKLILASTQYRGGARVITAAQQLLDELLALRR